MADHATLRTRRERVGQLMSPVSQFMALESASGIVLLAAAVLALAWANSPWASSYHALLDQHLSVSLGAWRLDEPVHFWVNDVLMVLFFFLVGLEIKREVVLGELSEPRRVLLPVMGAVGGMAAPALIFLALAGSGGVASRGWGIPVATDIAFAVGVLTLAGSRVPFGLRVTLLALAIVDDIGGIIIIAAFYATHVQAWALAAVGIVLAVCYLLRQSGLWYLPIYVVLGILGWLFMHASGVHGTILGVALGLLAPWRPWQPVSGFVERMHELTGRFDAVDDSPETEEDQVTIALELSHQARDHVSPLDRLMHDLQPIVSFVIAPLFAFANAGIPVDPATLAGAVVSPVSIGVFLGLVVGKPLGILAMCWLAVRLGATLPEGVGWAGILAMGVVAGIGFTVALFVAGLSYADAALLTDAKLGVIFASLASGALGYLALRVVFRGGEAGRA